MLQLELERPLVFFDLETTGTMVAKDRIVEIAIIKIMPDGTNITKSRRLNPEMPIPPAATAIHGITDADVADAPTFRSVAQNLHSLLHDCDLGGYNVQKFDVPLLVCEFKRAGIDFDIKGRKIIDAYNIFCKLYPRTLTAAYKLFCGKDLNDAHSAAADTAASLEVLEKQLQLHPELPRTIANLNAYCDSTDPDSVDSSGRFKWSGDEVIVCFGKNAGTKLKDLAENDPSFLKWIMRSDFPDDVKTIAQDAMIGKFPVRQ